MAMVVFGLTLASPRSGLVMPCDFSMALTFCGSGHLAVVIAVSLIIRDQLIVQLWGLRTCSGL